MENIKEAASSPNTAERIDTKPEIMALEQSWTALGAVKEWYNPPNIDARQRVLAPLGTPSYHGVRTINNQFATKLMPAFMAEDENEGLDCFRAIEPHTTNQELTLLIGDADFLSIRRSITDRLASRALQIEHDVDTRLAVPDGQIDWNDRYQFREGGRRSLERLEEEGIAVSVNPTALSRLIEAYVQTKDTKLPLIEVLKNETIVTINGFADSKISHIIHDAIDHMWGFQLIKQHGLDEKFSDFWTSIGNPAGTDIFKREGEIVSSIGFGVRYGSTQENGFRPLTTGTDLKKVYSRYFDEDKLLPRHMEAFRILRALPADSREMLSLGFTYSNYVTELNEQRRKHGKIKLRGENGSVEELSALSPDFLSLFVELHHQILAPQNKHRDTLFRFHILLEEYLQGVACGKIPIEEPFIIKPQEMHEHDFTNTTVPTEKLEWMFAHYGFAATREDIV